MILLSGTPFTSGATYATEVENYARVVYNGSGFVVTTKDGKIMEYGTSTTSVMKNSNDIYDPRVLAWKLNKVTDTYGNSMTYTYSDYGQYLAQIDYAGQSVVFTYTNTVNPKKGWINTFLISQAKILSTITANSKTYGFVYTADNRLTTINETAPDNSIVKPTTINWGAENTTGIQQVNVGSDIDPTLKDVGASLYSADVNGDGYPDRIELWYGFTFNPKIGHVIVRLFDPLTKKYNTNRDGTYDFWADDNLTPALTTGDIDNDGKDEIIFYKKDWLVVLGLSNNTLSEKYPGINFNLNDFHQGYDKDRKIQLIPTNVNNDKYLDVVMVFKYYFDGALGWGDMRPGFTVFLGSATGLIKDDDRSYNNGNFKSLEVDDFDADGRLDAYGSWENNNDANNISEQVKFVSNYDNFHWASQETRYSADLNGDGLTDMLVHNNGAGQWFAYRNDGNYNFTQLNLNVTQNGLPYQIPFFQNGNDYTQNLIFIDYNGDGLVDIISCVQTIAGWQNSNKVYQNQWLFFKNKGNFNFEYDNRSYTFDGKLNLSTTADINGDGIADLVIPNNGSYYAFTMLNANRSNLVTSIVNGMGQANSFTYKNFSAYDQTPTTGVVRNLKAPLLIVETQTDPEGNVTTYTFEKPRIHTEGKGFLGFSTVTAVNATRNAKSISNYGYDPTYFGVNLIKQTITNVKDSLISVSKQYNGVKVIDTKRYIPIVTAQWSYDKLKNVVQKATADYSLYPNSTTQITTVKDSIANSNIIELTTKVVTKYTGPQGVTPYLPDIITTTRTQNGLSDSIKVSYSYTWDTNNIYKLKGSSETTNPLSTDYAVSTEYSNPDTWGHMRTVTVKAKDQNGSLQSRNSSVAYTTSGRFVANKTNTLGEITNYDWGNETLGLLNSETTVVGSVNGVGGTNRTTSYTYNGWGQLVETKYPDGIRKANVVQWNSDNTAAYYAYSETSVQAPVWIYYDALGREVRKETKGLNGNTIRVFTTYTADGKVDKVSEPTFNSTFNPATDNHTAYSYDADYGYVSSVKTPAGTTGTVYNKLTTTVTTPEGTSVTVTNAAGQTISSTVNDKTVTYEYYPNGLTKSSTPDGGQALTMEYNLQGKRTKLIDPDGGTVESYYDGFGELIWERQKIHNATDFITTTNTYDAGGLGLLSNINRNGEITTYTYDTNIKDRVNVIDLRDKNGNVKNRQTFTYDPTKITDRVTNVQEEIADNSGNLRTYNTGKVYDALGRIKKEIYPSGYYTVNSYDSYGNLTEVRDEVGSGHSIWKADTENALGQATSIYKGAKQTTYSYDPVNHQTTGIQADGVIDYSYGYYPSDDTHHANNLEWRADGITHQTEQFIYDTQNRLTNWDVYKNGAMTKQNSMSFDDNGNIKSKTDLGAYTLYYGGKNPDGSTTGRPDQAHSAIGPHTLSAISGVPASPFPQTDLTVTYTDFKKIKTLDEGTKHYELSYGVDDQRRMSVYSVGSTRELTRYYVGNYEEEVLPNGNVRKIHYLSGAVLIQTTGVADSLYYSYSDAQGSLIALVHDGGNVIQRFAYDPWGARRDPNDWTQKDSRTSFIINRGYTGHEHLDAFGIINMNGRVYDPLTAQFFSPDPYVQAPGDWLNYNRYGYCMGNPFKYTDPNGYRWNWNAIIAGVVGIGVGILTGGAFLIPFIGAVVGGTVGSAVGSILGTALNGGSFGDCFLAGTKGAIIGGVSGGVGGAAGIGVGDAIGKVGGFWGGAALGAGGSAAGGFVGSAGNAWADGASFGDGLMAGLKGAGIGAMTGGLIGGAIGGINAVAHNGNFWNGDGFTSEFSVSELEKLTGKSADNIPVEYNNESLSEYQEYFNPEGVGNQYANGTPPPGYEKSGDAFVRQQSWLDKFF